METRFGKLARRWATAFAVVLSGFGGNASAILLDRGPDMVYDTVLDITWTRQAGDGVARNWADANARAADRKSTRLNSSHSRASRMPSSA